MPLRRLLASTELPGGRPRRSGLLWLSLCSLLQLLLLLLLAVCSHNGAAAKNHQRLCLAVWKNPGIDPVTSLQVTEFLGFCPHMYCGLLAALIFDDELLAVYLDDIDDEVFRFLHRAFGGRMGKQLPYAKDETG